MEGALIGFLAELGLASGVARSSAVYALVSAGHVLGIALLLGPILLVDLRLLGLLRALDAEAVRLLRAAARTGLALAVAMGVLLLSAKPMEYAANPVIWAKLAVVAAGIANALLFELAVWRKGLPALLHGAGRASAAASIGLWLSALLLGRWIAFV